MTWEKWMSCPVKFAHLGEDQDGQYDKDNDIIILDIGKLEFNFLPVYLYLLLRRGHQDKNAEWVTEQTNLMWNSMTIGEQWELGRMLFDSTGEEE